MAVVALAGCVSFSPDGGMERVSALTQERTGKGVSLRRIGDDATASQRRVSELLSHPLSPDDAVEIALLDNRGLQAQLGNLGLAEADLVEAGRLRGPQLEFGRLAGGGALEVDRSVVFDVLGLLTMPARRAAAKDQFERAQLQAASDAVSAAQEAREAFFHAVTDEQLVAYARQVMDAAQASSDLAARMAQVGNLSKLDQMREQAFFEDTSKQLAMARLRAVGSRERLMRALGLAGDQVAAVKLPPRLPDLPVAPAEAREVEQTAMTQRLDILMARREVDATARRLGLTKVTGMIDALDAGWQDKSQSGQAAENGFQVRLELPLFDFGSVNRARVEAQYRQAVDAAAARAVDAQSEVREAHATYLEAYDIARRYRDDVLPLRKRISDENLLRYNGMLVDVFQLLADARQQVGTVVASIEAQRDFWLAQARLQMTLTGRSPGVITPVRNP